MTQKKLSFGFATIGHKTNVPKVVLYNFMKICSENYLYRVVILRRENDPITFNLPQPDCKMH